MFTRFMIVARCLFVLYVLSIGPAYWLVSEQQLVIEVYSTFYGPLFEFLEPFPLLDAAVQWYTGLLVPEEMPPPIRY